MELALQIPQSQQSLLKMLHYRILILEVNRFLYCFKQFIHIAKPEQPLDKGIGFELLKLIKMLARTYKHNGTLGRRNRTQRSSPLRMSIQLSYDHASYVHCFPKGQRLIITGLSNGAIHYKQNLVRIYRSFYLLHLIK